MKKIFIKILIITLIISAILGIAIILLDLWNDITEKILTTTGVVFVASICGLCSSTLEEKKKVLSKIGIIFTLFSAIYFILLIWEIIPNTDSLDYLQDKIVLCIVLLNFSYAHISLILKNLQKDNLLSITIISTIIFSIIMDILLILLIVFYIETDMKIIAILSILIALGTILSPILNKLKKP